MGNDGSKSRSRAASTADDNDGPIRIGGGRKTNASNSAAAETAAAHEHARRDSLTPLTLDGHSPYIPPLPASASSLGLTGQQQSFDEDRRSDLSYAALDDFGSVPNTPAGAGGGSARGNSKRDDGPVSIGRGRRPSQSDIVQLNRPMDSDDADLAALHPEVEALLALAQFFPSDPSYAQRHPVPPGALPVTPVLLRPRMVMDVVSSLGHRWSGVGAAALRRQVMVSKEMDKIDSLISGMMPAIQQRNLQMQKLNEQLRTLPEMHQALQKQQNAMARCCNDLQELKSASQTASHAPEHPRAFRPSLLLLTRCSTGFCVPLSLSLQLVAPRAPAIRGSGRARRVPWACCIRGRGRAAAD